MLMTIYEWGEIAFASPKSKHQLRQFAKTNQIYPPAIKVGRTWHCEDCAKFVGLKASNDPDINQKQEDNPLLKRIMNDGRETQNS